MARKKIVFVIVEGPSDEDALGAILSNYFDKNTLHVQVEHCDITTVTGNTSTNIINRVTEEVKRYAKDNHYKKSDFLRVIHITDMDGAFVDTSKVLKDSSYIKAYYDEDAIRTNDPDGIIRRNKQKQENLNRLSICSTIWTDIPYAIYYMSCNLDHVLYNKKNSSDKEKEADAFNFAMTYKDDISSFLSFISRSEFAVSGIYQDTWNFIKHDIHSLERHSNLRLCFENEEHNSQ